MSKVNGKSFFGRSGKYYALVGSVILLIAVTHFVLQMSFIQDENLRSVETAVETPAAVETPSESAPAVRQIIEIQPQQVEVVKVPEYVKTVAPRREKETVPVKIPERKKVVRESKPERDARAARLRRAERLLTGV